MYAPINVEFPDAVEVALTDISEGYRRPLDAVGAVVVSAVRSNPDIRWKLPDVRAVLAEARMADMFQWLSSSGHTVAIIGGEGIKTNRFLVLPQRVCNRIRVYRYSEGGIWGRPRVEFDMLAWVDRYPVIGESKSGCNSFDLSMDFDRKVAGYREAFGLNRDNRPHLGPAVIMAVPDDHELVYGTRNSISLYQAGGRVLTLNAESHDLNSYATSLYRELGISY